MPKTVLGRGLGALMGGGTKESPARPPAAPAESSAGERVEQLPVAKIQPCSFQPRKDFSAESLRELADSIKEQGIIQPLVVRLQKGNYELIAGERRWRAAQLLGLTDVPAIVRQADDRTVLQLALIENLQRENLNAIEEAMGYAELINQFHLTQEETARQVGRGRVVVANALRLLKLPATLQSWVREGRLSVGHAKVILGLATAEEQKLASERVLKNSLSVRQTEELVSRLQNGAGTNGKKTGALPDAHVASLCQKLQEKFGTKVTMRYSKGKGAIEIKFFSGEDLERILAVAGIPPDLL